MDSMYSAIKGRRGGLMGGAGPEMVMMDEEASEPSQGAGMDMKSLVGALSDDQKMQLLKLLVGSSGGDKMAPKSPIEEGGQSPGEEDDLEASLGEGHESEDEIAENLLASSDRSRSEAGDKPRNLSERMRFGLAKKLKNKGK